MIRWWRVLVLFGVDFIAVTAAGLLLDGTATYVLGGALVAIVLFLGLPLALVTSPREAREGVPAHDLFN